MQFLANIFFTAAVCLLQAYQTTVAASPECSLNCNKGTCKIISGQNPQCECPLYFSGTNCDNYQCNKFCESKGMCYTESVSSNTSVPRSSEDCHCNSCAVPANICDGKCYNGGTCRNSKSGLSQCICKPGYTGERCQYCSNLECKNGGICVNNGTNETCQCADGYHGQNCEKSDCDHYCLSGGICTLNPTGPISTKVPDCTCPPLYSGPRCEMNLCLQPNPPKDKCNNINSCGCLNNGTCETRFGSKICKCTDIWGGDICQHYSGHNSPCINWCHNNGICTMKNARDFPSCICDDGWSGEQCDQALNCQYYCVNGGTCYMRNGAPYCQCTPEHKGTHCHELNDAFVSGGSASVAFSASLTFGIVVLVIFLFGGVYYVIRRRRAFFHRRLLENDFNNPMFQERDFD